jgi:hypothetical protein
MFVERNAPGDVERARELLTNARTTAAAHGYANVERRASEALQGMVSVQATCSVEDALTLM